MHFADVFCTLFLIYNWKKSKSATWSNHHLPNHYMAVNKKTSGNFWEFSNKAVIMFEKNCNYIGNICNDKLLENACISLIKLSFKFDRHLSIHSSEKRGLRSTKCSSKTLQKGSRTFAFGGSLQRANSIFLEICSNHWNMMFLLLL